MLNFTNDTLYQMKQTRLNTVQTGEVLQELWESRVVVLGGGCTLEELMPTALTSTAATATSYNPQKTTPKARKEEEEWKIQSESISKGGRSLNIGEDRSLWQGQVKTKHHIIIFHSSK